MMQERSNSALKALATFVGIWIVARIGAVLALSAEDATPSSRNVATVAGANSQQPAQPTSDIQDIPTTARRREPTESGKKGSNGGKRLKACCYVRSPEIGGPFAAMREGFTGAGIEPNRRVADATEAVEKAEGAGQAERVLVSRPHPAVRGSAWMIARASGGAPFANMAGQLGGPQVGARLALPLIAISPATELAASVRGSAALSRRSGRELGLGLSLAHRTGFPVEMIVERRVSLSKGQRDSWGALVASGFDDVRIIGDLRANGFVQAGGVRRDRTVLFAEGAVRVELDGANRTLRGIRPGFGAWAAAQNGLNRVDMGPTLTARPVLGGRQFRVSAEWRQRIAGSASPGSGPALAIGADF